MRSDTVRIIVIVILVIGFVLGIVVGFAFGTGFLNMTFNATAMLNAWGISAVVAFILFLWSGL